MDKVSIIPISYKKNQNGYDKKTKSVLFRFHIKKNQKGYKKMNECP